jgi:hypothetical protein
MPSLSLKEVRNRAHAFAKEWQGETREHAEAQPFWEAFFNIFGVSRRRVASFEEPVKKASGAQGRIDLLWKGKLLIEHKSAGKNLEKAYTQALDYFPGLKDEELPRYVLLSDFARFALFDLDKHGKRYDFSLQELPDNLYLFDFISGYEDDDRLHHDELELNFQASAKLGALYDALKDSAYPDHALRIFLTRILFCLFAEDTGIFARHQFVDYILRHTAPDGGDTDMHLAKLFQVLDTPESQRHKNLAEALDAFPYVNGHLFSERLDLPSFDAEMRDQLLECARFDWRTISPAIFGSLFQGIMEKKERRAAGAHYTSETNILRLIKPLFLDELNAEFERIQGLKRGKQQYLQDFQQKLSKLHFFDPACGCGNFLIITYRELRRLELRVLREQYGARRDSHLELAISPLIDLGHFHGIELDEWPARIGEVAMWLTQHQMNREFAQQFGREPDLLPLKTAAHIINANALLLDWASVSPQVDFILGNPPFIGSKYQSAVQKQELAALFGNIRNAKQLDYVACWFYKTAQFIQNTKIKAAFVSTNSITQGEQVAPLWKALLEMGVQIDFAHRTFAWQSEARGKAAVHVVIVGFSIPSRGIGAASAEKSRAEARAPKRLFDYPDIKGEPVEVAAENINPYLIDAPDVVVSARTKPLDNKTPIMFFGSQPNDGGGLLLSPEEKKLLIELEPNAEKWVRPILGAEEFINGKARWCLWLLDISPNELRALPEVLKRIEITKKHRLSSDRPATRDLAATPTRFGFISHPEQGAYILVPSVSSERREYVPMGFFDSHTISTNLNLIIPNASLYEFGVLESKMHMAWLRAVCGRLESRYRYSAKLVYNNFPWPDRSDVLKKEVEKAAQMVLDARAEYPASTLADLYHPLTMPASLRKAHQKLDAAVDACYRKQKFKDDGERLAFLFARYQALCAAATR